MTSTAATIVVLQGESFQPCLSSLSDFDRIHVLTDDPEVLVAVRNDRVDGRLIARPPCIESIGADILAMSSEDWLLLIDPDEVFMCADPSAFRSVLENTAPNVVGYGIPYEIRAFGAPLRTTYAGLRKTKLVRPANVRWEATIHGLPAPADPHHRFLDFPATDIGIVTELIANVTIRLGRHAQWASIEAGGTRTAIEMEEIVSRLRDVLHEYFLERSCASDGTVGILNGLLHLNKTIATLLYRAALSGVADEDANTADALGRHVLRLADALRAKDGSL